MVDYTNVQLVCPSYSINPLCIFTSPPDVLVEFDPTSYTVSESGRLANITVVKRGQTTQTVSVSFTTADGTATGECLFTM